MLRRAPPAGTTSGHCAGSSPGRWGGLQGVHDHPAPSPGRLRASSLACGSARSRDPRPASKRGPMRTTNCRQYSVRYGDLEGSPLRAESGSRERADPHRGVLRLLPGSGADSVTANPWTESPSVSLHHSRTSAHTSAQRVTANAPRINIKPTGTKNQRVASCTDSVPTSGRSRQAFDPTDWIHEEIWWARQDSNLRPKDYESPALTS